ncbi:MAG TPA: acetolactate synthase [Opitutales bacterium]|nr:acetolactate synthase [Opitutales bacterium]
MAATITRKSSHGGVVKQFSVFAENKVGRLHDVVNLLAGKDVHVLALCLVDTTDSTIIRLVVDYPEVAAPLLTGHGFSHSLAEVLAIEIDTEARLQNVTAALVQAEINIHYIYPFLMRPHNKTGLVLRLEDPDLASEVLKRNQITVLTQTDLAR